MFLTALWDKEEVELCIVSPEFVEISTLVLQHQRLEFLIKYHKEVRAGLTNRLTLNAEHSEVLWGVFHMVMTHMIKNKSEKGRNIVNVWAINDEESSHSTRYNIDCGV